MKLRSLLETEISTGTVRFPDGDVTITADATLHPKHNALLQYEIGFHTWNGRRVQQSKSFNLDKRYTREQVLKLVRGLYKHLKNTGSAANSMDLVDAMFDVEGFEDLADSIIRGDQS